MSTEAKNSSTSRPMGAAEVTKIRVRSRPIRSFTGWSAPRFASWYCTSSSAGTRSPASERRLRRSATSRDRWRIRCRAGGSSFSRACARARSFSYTRGTPKKMVGRASRRFSPTFSRLSAK